MELTGDLDLNLGEEFVDLKKKRLKYIIIISVLIIIVIILTFLNLYILMNILLSLIINCNHISIITFKKR